MDGFAMPQVSQQGQEMDDDTKQKLMQAMLMTQMHSGAAPDAPVSQPHDTSDVQQTANEMSAQPSSTYLPPQPKPDVTLAHAFLADQPATQYVQKAQGALDAYQDRPMWKKMLGPGLIALGSTLGAHSRNGLKLQEMGQQDQQELARMGENKYQSLVGQVGSARQLQQQEYEADQRNRQQDILMAGNNQTKTLMAQIAAGSRENVANTAGQSRRDVASTNVQGREIVAGTQGDTARDVAGIKGGFDVQVAHINAQAALNRFLAGQAREDQRQRAGFAHTDLKPTADEDRRADLSEAMIGYATILKDIASRRPELFGPLAGRATQARQWIGSDDPDVMELKALKEQLGITQMGAHSLRSAQTISPIADSLVNSFNSPAESLIPTLDMAIKGVSQFTGPQQRPSAYYPGGESTNTTPSRTTTNPLAPRVKAQATPQRPAGVPAGAHWDATRNGGKGSWVM